MSSWIDKEFKESKFKDKRLKDRFIQVAKAFAKSPSSSIPAQSNDWSETKAAYRLFKNENFTSEDFFAPHLTKLTQRASSYPFILAIQDSTILNYKGHSRDNGMGETRNNSWGCHLHSTLALAPNGMFLGVLSNLLWSRPKGRKKSSSGRPIYKAGEEKESEKWNESLRKSCESLEGKTKILSICDREADTKSFILNSAEMETEFLIRHSNQRSINESSLLSMDYIKSSKVRGSEKVLVTNKKIDKHGKSLRVKDENGKCTREAVLKYQFERVSCDLQIESYKKRVSFSMIRVYEEDDVEGRIDWILLTSLPVESLEDAKTMVFYYSLRWRIEVFFKSLKSGCRVEKCRLSSLERMEKFINLATIIAWRLNEIKYLGELKGEGDALEVLSEIELEILKKRVNFKGEKVRIRDALLWIGRLGGHLNRKRDGLPGVETLWKGLSRLNDLEEGYLLSKSF